MSIFSAEPTIGFLGNGSTTEFPFPFRVFAASDIIVMIGGAVVATGFTVTGVDNNAGGVVTFTTPPAAGVQVVLHRRVPESRETDFSHDVPVAALNEELDRIVAEVQQLRDDLQRAARMGPTFPDLAYLPTPVENRLLKWAVDAATGVGRLVNTTYDPDLAAAAAYQAQLAAQQAANDAAAARALAENINQATSVDPVAITLVTGVASYDLGPAWPALEMDERHYRVTVGRDRILMYTTDFEITSIIRAERTITLALAVVASNPAADQLLAGSTMIVFLTGTGLYAYRDKSVQGRHIDDYAIEHRHIKAGNTINGWEHITPYSIPLTGMAPAASRSFLRYNTAGLIEAVPPPVADAKRFIGIDGTGPAWIENHGSQVLGSVVLGASQDHTIGWDTGPRNIVVDLRNISSRVQGPLSEGFYLQIYMNGVHAITDCYVDGSYYSAWLTPGLVRINSEVVIDAITLAFGMASGDAELNARIRFSVHADAVGVPHYQGEGNWLGGGGNPVTAWYSGRMNNLVGRVSGVRLFKDGGGAGLNFNTGTMIVWSEP